tara:strand:+ start:116 stop:319 length:204 start_codon:yes stop_codon:yes gene_type:complete
MARKAPKYEKSIYKYVIKEFHNDLIRWKMTIKGYSQKRYKTEREAAISVDKILIYQGREPVNILVRK